MQWSKHPILKLPTRGQLQALLEDKGAQAVHDVWKAREDAIRLSEEDPVNHSFYLPQQEKVEELLKEKTECWVFGGNRSGKSFTSARIVMKALMDNPETTIICWSQNEDASIEMQQPYLHQMLPQEWKHKFTEGRASINYNDKSGFTGKKFVLPNGSKCLFRFYSQFIGNPKMIEGYRLGLAEEKCKYTNVGTWLDEYYMDEKLIKRLYRRCNDNNAKILVSFTPLDGYTPTVAKALKGARTTATLYGAILDREMPYTMQPKKQSSAVVFFHTERNPFTNIERLKEDLDGETDEEVQTIAYGYPTKSITTIFPLFSEQTHVIETIPKITRETHTVYQVIDPAGARNFFCLWAAVDKDENVTILREWPDRGTYGEWASFGDPKWKFGPASKKLGYAIKTDTEQYSYVHLFKEIEAELGVEVFERIGDSRFMATEHDDQDMFTDFEEKGMYIVPSDGRTEDSGIQLIDQWFAYNPNIEIDSINKPKLHIHESCGNLIYSLINYQPDGKKSEALKDPIDCLRYLRTANQGEGPLHFTGSNIIQKGRGGY